MMERTVNSETKPATVPISSRAICPKRFSVAPHRTEKDDEVLDCASQHSTDQYPQDAREVTKLSRQSWPDQRSGTRNCRKVMTEQNPLVRGLEILAIPQSLSRSGPPVVQPKYPNGEEAAVKTES